ncbi:cyclic pyranopterin phosphate synthase [Halogranum gelatinilyticum]|uniref:Probable GTP 3',8-cyclase n=1 Tax=Halogranum gelatinilyticum TaxID=660521 RepID=A0A1G9T637_9EURY|nr:GTP 3',8-cyclase MoaA [Halogranum gelatinilyticum]SDM43097.1 cyclic pyranopterin phosphate synthase [Halogranum gelatinilyticum]
MLEDDFGREVSGVRISLTDRCNFDCVYCHNEGLGDTRGPMDAQDSEMSADDVVRFLEVVEEFGVEKVKFTGGEPMLRQDLEEIIRRTPDSMETSLTTNGTFLPGRAEALKEAGLDRVNVSQDALDREAFAEITKSGAYEKVIEGVHAAVDAGLTPVKLNMVVFKHTAGYVEGMVDHVAENEGLQLQLIQYMPELTGKPEWNIDIGRVHDWLADLADRVETRDMHDRKRYYVGEGMVEIVDPVENETFCANCHRVRVTHEGYLKGCLNRNDDLKSMGEMTKAEIRETFREVVANRVPYYGEYLVQNDSGEYVLNEKYLGVKA